MTSQLPYAFEAERLLGTLFEIGPSYAKAILRSDAVSEGRWLHGSKFPGGRVGEFVAIECNNEGIFGRITHVALPEKERRNVDSKPDEIHPVATIQLLTSFSPAESVPLGGLVSHPAIGNSVFSANPRMVKALAESVRTKVSNRNVLFEIGTLPDGDDVVVCLTPEKIFGRHCAVLGSTGGGKSYTLASLIEEAMKCKSKVLLFDATGEFHATSGAITHLQLGGTARHGETIVSLPYTELNESDFFALFRPAPGVQAPKLRAALKSLKLAKIVPALAPTGYIPKATKLKAPVEAAYLQHSVALQSPKAAFDIAHLLDQIEAECVYHTAGPLNNPDPTRWGNANDGDRGHCVSLVSRIEVLINGPELQCVFKPGAAPSLFAQLKTFLADPAKRILRISMRDLSFAYNTREIVANAIGRHLMELARSETFTKSGPLVVMLDEAHQFLNKHVGEDATATSLDAFELIAKEGRKHWLTICMATQRPRDIPEGVLSQMGTMIVHRLTNEADRRVVEKAAGQLDQSASEFLPTLAPGEAAVIGVDFPIPLTVQINRPKAAPSSSGPDFQKHWA